MKSKIGERDELMTNSRRRIPINNNASADETPPAPAPVENGGNGTVDTQPAESRLSGASDKGPEAAGREQEAQPESAADSEVSRTTVPEADAALARVMQEREDLADSLLRLRAEFENFRKRANRELVQARERAQGELLGELLPVLDNLERALDAAEHHEEGKVLAGVRMTRDMFVELLKRVGVEEIQTLGAQFDPVIHEAMLMEPSENEEGMVTAVLERGYRQGDYVLRPAKVAVSSGPGAPSEPAAAG
jgi:molecular chaperone GrpE